MTISDFFNKSALVEKTTVTQNDMGGTVDTYSTRIAALDCRIDTKRINEPDEKGKMLVRTIYRLYCLATSTNKAIVESDRITIDSLVYLITGIANPALLDRHLEIDLRRVI